MSPCSVPWVTHAQNPNFMTGALLKLPPRRPHDPKRGAHGRAFGAFGYRPPRGGFWWGGEIAVKHEDQRLLPRFVSCHRSTFRSIFRGVEGLAPSAGGLLSGLTPRRGHFHTSYLERPNLHWSAARYPSLDGGAKRLPKASASSAAWRNFAAAPLQPLGPASARAVHSWASSECP